ncbi:MAG TPA: two-component regulator propeller domain-containing protein [Planctomycetaceae bacterium]|nr:two-component regulator propeller domain-containing protein [Planctomycetaceae bacterium]
MLDSAAASALDSHRALTQALLRKWQVQQGLPQATIFKIFQTSDRYIWLGTQSGLFHFDGVRFAPAQGGPDVSIASVWIEDLCEDHDGHLWIATNDSGLIRLHGRAALRLSRAEGLPTEHVSCLCVDHAGDLWAGTNEGLVRLRKGEITVYRTEQGLSTNDVRALCQDGDGTVWSGGEGAVLSIWDGAKFSSRKLESLPPRASIRAIASAKEGALWIGTTAGLVELSAGHERRMTRAEGLADDSIECLACSRDGTLWVGTRDGISRLNGDDIETFRTRDGLSQSTVFTLCEDHEANVWAGTKHGLNQFVDRRTIPLTASEGLPGNDTGPVLEDEAGMVWIGTLGNGLARFDGRRCSPAVTTHDGLTSNTILSLACGERGELWIGTDVGLCRMRAGRIDQSFTTGQGLPSNAVSCLCRDGRGVLWAGTALGLAEFDGDRFVPPEADREDLRLAVVALVDGGDSLIVSTAGGRLFRCTDHAMRALTDAPETHDVSAFFQDAEGLLWMGTQGNGLAMIEDGKIHRFTVKDGLYDDDLFGIVADDLDRLWMACSRGIFYMHRADLRAFAAGRLSRLTSTPFSPTDAQRTVECQSGVQPAVCKLHGGGIWFSTIHGVIIVDPAHLKRVLPPPAVLVEEAQVNGQDVHPGQIPKLPPGRTNVYFRYTALSYASPTRIAFRHKLDGFDKDWIEAGSRREAFYTNLPPGSYRFRVSAANLDGPWSEAEQPVELALQPYFYQTRWFIPATAASIALAGWLAFRLRVLQVKARWNAVLAERSRIARELHDTLIQGFSGITMQMQGLAARLNRSPERQTLEEIIQDAGSCLRDARRSVGGLRSASGNSFAGDRTAGLAAAVAQAARQLTETRDVRLSLRLAEDPQSVPVEVEYNVLRIAQEAISNAVKHSGARTIEVAMNCTPQLLCLTIRDDGVGFAADNGEHSQSGHYGLVGMRERAAQIHGELSLESQAGRGTTVRLELPRIVDARRSDKADGEGEAQ